MLIRAEVWSIAKLEQGTTILLKPVGSNAAIPLFIGASETHSLLAGMHNIPLPRPLSHDLMISLMAQTETTLKRIVIYDLHNGIYHAKLSFKGRTDSFTLEARPSDALALAVRSAAPLYIEEKIIAQSSVRVELDGEKENSIEILEEKMLLAVKEEDYEEAAHLRDKLRQLKNSLT